MTGVLISHAASTMQTIEELELEQAAMKDSRFDHEGACTGSHFTVPATVTRTAGLGCIDRNIISLSMPAASTRPGNLGMRVEHEDRDIGQAR